MVGATNAPEQLSWSTAGSAPVVLAATADQSGDQERPFERAITRTPNIHLQEQIRSAERHFCERGGDPSMQSA